MNKILHRKLVMFFTDIEEKDTTFTIARKMKTFLTENGFGSFNLDDLESSVGYEVKNVGFKSGDEFAYFVIAYFNL